MNNQDQRNIARARFASLTRRHFLRGLGACLALPAFESVRPLAALAAEAGPGTLATAGARNQKCEFQCIAATCYDLIAARLPI